MKLKRSACSLVLLALFSFLFLACGPSAARSPRPSFAKVETTSDAGGGGDASIALAGHDASAIEQLNDLTMTSALCLAEPKKTASHAEASADAAMVARIVRRGWAGFETMSKQGVDFDAIFTGLDRWIASEAEPIAIETFQAHLVQALHPAADNHLAFFMFGPKGHAKRQSVGSHQTAFTADLVLDDLKSKKIVSAGAGVTAKGAVLVSCSADGGIEGLFQRTITDALVPAYRPIVLAEKPPSSPLRCTIRRGDAKIEESIELPMRPLHVDRAVNQNVPAFEQRETTTGVPILKLHSFWSGKSTDLEAFVASAPRLRDAKAIVVDVRGNGGGSDSYAKRWVAGLGPTNNKLTPTVVDRLDSDVTRQGMYNDNLCEIAEGLPDEAAKAEAEDRLHWASMEVDTAQRAGELFRRWQSRTLSPEGSAPEPFKAPLIVLTDQHCASACEAFLQIVKDVDNGIVIGENSGGVGVFGEVLVYRLPKTGLGMSAGMKHFHSTNPLRDIPEGRGFLPDVWLDTSDALAVATRLAECFAKSKPGAKCGAAALLK